MAFNVRSGGDHVEIPVDETVKAGDVVIIGDFTGVAELDATPRPDGQHWTTVALEGVAYLALEDAPGLGDAIYAHETEGLGPVGIETGVYNLVGYVINTAPTANGGYEIKLANGPKVEV